MAHDLWDSPGGYYRDFSTYLARKALYDNIRYEGDTPNHGNSCWARNVPQIPGVDPNGHSNRRWLCQNQSALEFLVDHYLRMKLWGESNWTSNALGSNTNDSYVGAPGPTGGAISDLEDTIAAQCEHVAEQITIALQTGGTYSNVTMGPPSTIRWIPPGGENTFKHGNDNPNPAHVGVVDTDTARHTSCNGLIAAFINDDIRAKLDASAQTAVLHAISLHLEWWCGIGFDGTEVDPPRVGGRTGTKPEGGWRADDYLNPGFDYGHWLNIRAFVFMHKLTDNREWLNQAKIWLDFHFKSANERTTIQNGKVYTTFDTARINYKRGGTETNNDGSGDLVTEAKGGTEIQFTEWNWYDGQCVSTLYMLIHEMEHDDINFWQNDILRYEDIILKKTEWGAHGNRAANGPVGDRWVTELGAGVRAPSAHPVTELNYTGDRDLINLQVHGGIANTAASTDGYLLFSDVASILTPTEWDALASGTTYYPLFGLQHHMLDGEYFEYFWDPGTWTDERWHHQKRWENIYWLYGPIGTDPNHPLWARVQPGGDLYNRFLTNLPQGPFAKSLSQDNYEVANAQWVRYKVLEKRSSCSDYSEAKLWAEWLVHDGYGYLGSGATQTPKSKSQRATVMGWSTGGRSIMFTLRHGQIAAGDQFSAGTKFMRYSGPALPTDP